MLHKVNEYDSDLEMNKNDVFVDIGSGQLAHICEGIAAWRNHHSKRLGNADVTSKKLPKNFQKLPKSNVGSTEFNCIVVLSIKNIDFSLS